MNFKPSDYVKYIGLKKTIMSKDLMGRIGVILSQTEHYVMQNKENLIGVEFLKTTNSVTKEYTLSCYKINLKKLSKKESALRDLKL